MPNCNLTIPETHIRTLQWICIYLAIITQTYVRLNFINDYLSFWRMQIKFTENNSAKWYFIEWLIINKIAWMDN